MVCNAKRFKLKMLRYAFGEGGGAFQFRLSLLRRKWAGGGAVPLDGAWRGVYPAASWDISV